jgi:hypothetical protein
MSRREPFRALQNNPQADTYYLVSVVAKGWAVPAHLSRHGDVIQLTQNGSQHPETWSVRELPDAFADAVAGGTLFEHPLFRVVLFGERCDETTYRHRLAIREWAVNHASWHPSLRPDQPIDQRLLPATDF